MAEVDPLTAIALAEGERVLWQGRPALGAPLAEVKRIVAAGVSAWTLGVVATQVAVAAASGSVLTALPETALWWMLMVGPFVAVVLLGRVVGPFHLSLTLLTLAGPALALVWASRARALGWSGALARLTARDFVVAALLLGLPLVRVAVGLVRRLNEVYVATDRRVVAVRLERDGATLLWAAPLVINGRFQVRVTRPWGGRGRATVVVGHGALRHELRMVEAPDAVVMDLRRGALEEHDERP
jgi:hypothetical protein